MYFYLLADAHDRERDGVEQQKIPSRDRASDGRTDSDGIVSGIIVGQNIRTFFISKAKEREGERERMEERVRARGGKRGTPKREGDRRNRRGSEAAIEAEYKVALFRYVDGRTDGARADRRVGERRERRGSGATQLNS